MKSNIWKKKNDKMQIFKKNKNMHNDSVKFKKNVPKS